MYDNLWPLALSAGFGMVFGAYFHIIWKETSIQVKKLRDAYEGKNKKAEKHVRWEAPPQGFNCRCLPLPVLPGDDSLLSALSKQTRTSDDLRDQLETKTQLLAVAQKELAELRATKGMQVLIDPTYHDVIVHAAGRDLRLFDHSYGLRLTCTRAGGWELWNMWGGEEELLGGEYAGLGPFSVSVQGMIICQTNK